MKKQKKPVKQANAVSSRSIIAIVAIVLVGTVAGSFVASKVAKKDAAKKYDKPGALGHEVPMPPDTNNMVWIPPGKFWMGAEDGQSDEKPVHEIEVNSFWMDKTEVTNEEFEKFVRATRYVTVAERKPDPKDFPGVPLENLVAGSIVFTPPPGEVPLDNHYAWWSYVPGASWRHPQGPDSNIRGLEKHPVVQVCWDDAMAYCKWAGRRLPTEAEWEYASRGGLDRQAFSWGKDKVPDNKWQANIWQGQFPNENSLSDGFRGTAPVATFPSNKFGLYDMGGNVWEWCADWYRPDYYEQSAKKNPSGPGDSFDPNEPGVAKRVTRGGSFLCSELYCTGYRPSARMKTSPDTGLSHTGFRCVKD